MKFLLFCEGKTEDKSLPGFIKRWLDTQLSQRVGVRAVKFQGWGNLYNEVAKKARLRLMEDDVIAVISLLDLYGPTFYPDTLASAEERYEWGKSHIETMVGDDRFRHFFAVHEVEAWLLSDPSLFPREVREALPSSVRSPELINFNEPPAKLLERLYLSGLNRNYKKVTNGKALYSSLDPLVARQKCPSLAKMLDEMLALAKQAGM